MGMDGLSIILAVIAGALLGLGRGSWFSEFGDHHPGKPEQPWYVQVTILTIVTGLILFIFWRLNKMGISNYIPAIVAFGVSVLTTMLVFWHTGPGGEPILRIPILKEIRFNQPNLPESFEELDTHDLELEAMIIDGNYKEAREYLDEKIHMAKEMGDVDGQRDYEKYRPLLTQASMKDSRRRGDGGRPDSFPME